MDLGFPLDASRKLLCQAVKSMLIPKYFLVVLVTLLILAGDVELNPGPLMQGKKSMLALLQGQLNIWLLGPTMKLYMG